VRAFKVYVDAGQPLSTVVMSPGGRTEYVNC